jgi:hypothetical protein
VVTESAHPLPFAGLAASVVLSACYRAPAPPPPGVPADAYAALLFGASQALACAADDIAYEPLPGGRHFFAGCARLVEMTAVVHGGAAPTWSAWPAPANRFARERACELRRTREERIDDKTRAVSGCGERAFFALVCRDGACAWEPTDDPAREKAHGPPPPDRNKNAVVLAKRGEITFHASSVYGSGYAPERLVDGDPATAWYSADGDSVAKGESPYVELAFADDVTVGRVTVLASRDPSYPTGYGVLSVRLELLDAHGVALYRADASATPGDPDQDFRLPRLVSGVRAVRLSSLADEGDQNPFGDVALGEVQIDGAP